MQKAGGAMRLRDWLILQIDSALYPGLMWDDAEKSLFRIPWKHAAKKDYQLTEDAALFKAWAVYKGKFREGKDKAEPSVWKTRLRCALNKSNDFQEVPARSQLDISEPYKVYRIQMPGVREGQGRPQAACTCRIHAPLTQSSKIHKQCGSHAEANRGWKERPSSDSLYFPHSTMEVQTPTQDALADEYSMRGGSCSQSMFAVLSLGPVGTFLPIELPTVFQITDFRLQVRLFYQGQLVQDFTTSTPGGCWILQGSLLAEDEHLFGPCAVEQVCFPPLEAFQMSAAVRTAMARLLAHLQHGVLVWVNPDGVFIKRFCQGRVYWDGPLAKHHDQPNKLEREKTMKLLDMSIFFQGLKDFLHGGAMPNFEINLCFGEEYPEPAQSQEKKLITAQVEPLFIKNLLKSIQRHPEETGPQPRRPRQDHRQQLSCPSPDSAVMLETSLAPLI